VSYVTAKTEKLSPKPQPMGKTVDRRVCRGADPGAHQGDQDLPPLWSLISVAGNCFKDRKCWLLQERAARE